MHSAIRIGLIGDFNHQHRAHHAIPRALAGSAGKVECVWIPTDSVGGGQSLADFEGLWCVPGMPYHNQEGVLRAIQTARMAHIPFLGTSAGFQYALIEFARNALGITRADHEMTNPHAEVPLISPLGCALAGVKARVRFLDGSLLRTIYRAAESVEEYHCSFGLNPRYRRLIEGGDLFVAAIDDQNEVRAVELDRHPFFVATLFQPELCSLAEGAPPSPVVGGFLSACAQRRDIRTKAAS